MSAPMPRTAVPIASMVPQSWLAGAGQLTPGGRQATYRSSPHALMGLRLAYLEHVVGETEDELAATAARYQESWERFVQHGDDMNAVVALLDSSDVEGAASAWNQIDQDGVNTAFRTVLGERERFKGRNLATHVWNHYGLWPCPSINVAKADRDRPLRPSDSTAAWNRSGDGKCRGCGTATISHGQRQRLHKVLKSGADGFNVEGVHHQQNGVDALLWPQVTIAAKGVAEHVVPRSQGGPTDPSNLTNACAGCNYARGDTSLEATGVVAYNRPPSEMKLAG